MRKNLDTTYFVEQLDSCDRGKGAFGIDFTVIVKLSSGICPAQHLYNRLADINAGRKYS